MLQVKKHIFGPDPAENRTCDPPHKNPTLYHVAIKAGLYRKAVQVCYIPIPCDILHLHIEIRPRISGSTRITGNETQGGLMHMWDIYVGRQMLQVKKNTFGPDPAEDRTRDPPHKNPTLYRVATKAGLYRKAVQVCYIPISCDTNIILDALF